MGYAKEKAKVEHKMKIVKRVVLCAVAAILLSLCILSVFVPVNAWQYYFCMPNVGARAEGEMRIHFIDVGQGDASLIELPDGKIVLIDGGNEEAASTTSLMRYLNALGIDTIDILLLTHSDSDHCGGLDTVLSFKTVKYTLLPYVTSSMENISYHDFYTAMLKEGCKYERFSRLTGLSSEDTKYPYTLEFVYPFSTTFANDVPDGADANITSAVLWLDYYGVSTLFTGDMPSTVEDILMGVASVNNENVELQSTEILKVAHHGSDGSSSLAFLEFLGSLQTAVISCGTNNIYGHPHADVGNNLAEVKAKTYRTDIHGSVIVTVKPNGTYLTRYLGK